MIHTYTCGILNREFKGNSLNRALNRASRALIEEGYKVYTVKKYSDVLYREIGSPALTRSGILNRLQRANKNGTIQTCVMDSKVCVIDIPENVEVIRDDLRGSKTVD